MKHLFLSTALTLAFTALASVPAASFAQSAPQLADEPVPQRIDSTYNVPAKTPGIKPLPQILVNQPVQQLKPALQQTLPPVAVNEPSAQVKPSVQRILPPVAVNEPMLPVKTVTLGGANGNTTYNVNPNVVIQSATGKVLGYYDATSGGFRDVTGAAIPASSPQYGLLKDVMQASALGRAPLNTGGIQTGSLKNQAVQGIAGATGLKGNVGGALLNGAANGNIQQVATSKGTGIARNVGSDAISKATGLNGGNSNALVNSALNGNLGSTAAKVGTQVATKEASSALAGATGLSRGTTGSLIRGVLGGGSGSALSVQIPQKNEYVAATDDGRIRGSANGGSGLGADLAKLGIGAASKLTLNPNGVISDGLGQITGRLDPVTGKLFDASGKEIASNSLQALRIKESIGQNGTGGSPSTVVASSPSVIDAYGIPSTFAGSGWTADQRKLEWAKLTPTQQASWLKEAQVKAGSGSLSGNVQLSNYPTPVKDYRPYAPL